MATHELFWISATGQGSIPMGVFSTSSAAERYIDQAQAILLSQALDDDDDDQQGLMTKSAVILGTWSITERT